MISVLFIPSLFAVFYLLLWVTEPKERDDLISVWSWFNES